MMENLRRTYAIVQQIARILRSAVNRLRYYRTFIFENRFNIREWDEMNMRDINTIQRNLSQYALSVDRNNEIINHTGTCMFLWHHVVDLYSRESLDYVKENIVFLDQQLEHIRDLLQMFDNEIERIERSMAAAN